ncbi:MAG TPA: trypsin-like serine protease [Candidatus Competibacteraceae bacterium]|nr:trypsin-like serine protease [Candidatus Competibacteraceae bacterium]
MSVTTKSNVIFPSWILIVMAMQSLLWGVTAQAQIWREAPAGVEDDTAEYWTPERLQRAKPIDLPRAAESLGTESLAVPVQGESISRPGSGPSIEVEPDNTQLFVPIDHSKHDGATKMMPQSSGTAQAYFTSSRVIPAPKAQTSYPFRPTGKLFFHDASSDAEGECSAAVIRPRLVITAGHCVYDAEKKLWYEKFQFQPAHHNGRTRYGRWNWQWVITTSSWTNDDGVPPNSADFALLEMRDDAKGRKIGNITGYYGWRTNALYPNHVTMLGYPVDFDSGSWMHRVDSHSFERDPVNNTVTYGSDMGSGSSGGPWLENFGEISAGQTVTPSGMNYVVGVTSYGVGDPLRYQGASILNDEFTNNSKTGILDIACTHRAGNCE